jgi:hypothetical protein
MVLFFREKVFMPNPHFLSFANTLGVSRNTCYQQCKAFWTFNPANPCGRCACNGETIEFIAFAQMSSHVCWNADYLPCYDKMSHRDCAGNEVLDCCTGVDASGVGGNEPCADAGGFRDVKLLNGVSIDVYQFVPFTGVNSSGVFESGIAPTLRCSVTTDCSGYTTCDDLDCGDYMFAAECLCWNSCSGTFKIPRDKRINISMTFPTGVLGGIALYEKWTLDADEENANIWIPTEEVGLGFEIMGYSSGFCVRGAAPPGQPPESGLLMCAAGFSDSFASRLICVYCEECIIYQTVTWHEGIQDANGGASTIVTGGPACGSASEAIGPQTIGIAQPVPSGNVHTYEDCQGAGELSSRTSGVVREAILSYQLAPTFSSFLCTGIWVKWRTEIDCTPVHKQSQPCTKCTGCLFPNKTGLLYGLDPYGTFTLEPQTHIRDYFWTGCHEVSLTNLWSGCVPASLSGIVAIYYEFDCYGDYFGEIRFKYTNTACGSGTTIQYSRSGTVDSSGVTGWLYPPNSGVCGDLSENPMPWFAGQFPFENATCGGNFSASAYVWTPRTLPYDHIPLIFPGYTCRVPISITD